MISIIIQLYSKSQQDTVKIGAILPLTGPGAPFGEASQNAILLALDEINATSQGPIFEVLIEDGMTDTKSSISAFNRLYDLYDTRLFLTFVSSVSLALGPLADQKEVLLFANASHPQITKDRKFVFRYSNTAKDEVNTLANFINSQTPKWSQIYIIALNDDYGRSYVQEMTNSNLDSTKITIAGVEYYDRLATDFRALATKAIAKVPDAVILIGFGRSMGLCIRQLRELGFDRPFIASLGFVLSKDAVVAAGESCRGGYYLNFTFVSHPGAKEFRRKYRSRYGVDPAPNAAIDYGTVYLLAQGVNAVGNNPNKLASYYHSLGKVDLPTGEVNISNQGDIVAPVKVMAVPQSGAITLWEE